MLLWTMGISMIAVNNRNGLLVLSGGRFLVHYHQLCKPVSLCDSSILCYNTIQYKLFNMPYIASESDARIFFLDGHLAKY